MRKSGAANRSVFFFTALFSWNIHFYAQPAHRDNTFDATNGTLSSRSTSPSSVTIKKPLSTRDILFKLLGIKPMADYPDPKLQEILDIFEKSLEELKQGDENARPLLSEELKNYLRAKPVIKEGFETLKKEIETMPESDRQLESFKTLSGLVQLLNPIWARSTPPSPSNISAMPEASNPKKIKQFQQTATIEWAISPATSDSRKSADPISTSTQKTPRINVEQPPSRTALRNPFKETKPLKAPASNSLIERDEPPINREREGTGVAAKRSESEFSEMGLAMRLLGANGYNTPFETVVKNLSPLERLKLLARLRRLLGISIPTQIAAVELQFSKKNRPSDLESFLNQGPKTQ